MLVCAPRNRDGDQQNHTDERIGSVGNCAGRRQHNGNFCVDTLIISIMPSAFDEAMADESQDLRVMGIILSVIFIPGVIMAADQPSRGEPLDTIKCERCLAALVAGAELKRSLKRVRLQDP